ncbi:MAG: 4Fe-4S binding protein [Phycisphaerales bacterium]|nr:4Fe-4S binding protein [Phycisphaerales bacterium]
MSEPSTHQTASGSTGAPCGPKVSVRLPVLASPPARSAVAKSKMGPWRAGVLVFIHLLIAVHLVQWVISGMSDGIRETISPVEPSESMFTLEGGQVNAGFVMFCAALLSTLVFGRFFCGWACHVVALQDLCAWMMKKIGVHPKPFRSRILLWAPLCLALYMFVWPTLRREVIVPMVATDINRDGQYSAYIYSLSESRLNRDLNHDGRVSRPGEPGDVVQGVSEEAVGLDLNGNGTRSDVVDVAHEYPAWLGDVIPLQGFDGHFIVEDFWATFAPWQIAIPFLFVCGFVTVYFLGSKAFCSYGCPYGGFFAPIDRLSPLRIRVNDDCHQCGHCTAVCTSNVRVHEEVRDFGAVVDPGCMKCLDCVSVCPNDALSLGFGAPAIKIKPRVDEHAFAQSSAKAQRRWDLTLREEVVVGALFLVMMIGYRGMYKAVPLLMAMGVAAVVAFMAYKTWRLAIDRNVRGPFMQLKRDGRLRPAGYLFALLAVALVAGGIQGLVMNVSIARGEDLYSKITTSSTTVFSPDYKPSPENKSLADRAVRHFTLAGPISRGGIGFASTFEQDVRLAWLRSVAGDRAAAEDALMRALAAREPSPGTFQGLIQFYRLRNAPVPEAEATFEKLLARWPQSDIVRGQLAGLYLAKAGSAQPDAERSALITKATGLYDERMRLAPRDTAAANSAATLRLRLGKPLEAIDLVRNALKHVPNSPLLRERLAQAMLAAGQDPAAAAEELRFAAQRQPTAERWGLLSELYRSLGRSAEADSAEARARALLGAAIDGANAPKTSGASAQPSMGGEIPSATK